MSNKTYYKKCSRCNKFIKIVRTQRYIKPKCYDCMMELLGVNLVTK